MELYRGTAPKVKFYLPTSDTTVTGATWALDGVDKGTIVPGTAVNGAVEVQLPYLQYDGEVAVNWTFSIPGSGSITDRTYYDIVTPLLTKEEVAAIFSPQPLDDAEYIKIEAAVRHVINAHCGQTFGKYIATWKVRGDASNSLELPARLLEALNINGDAGANYNIIGGGFNLRRYEYAEVNIKADIGVPQPSGVIYDPYSINRRKYLGDQIYSIYGIWGYNAVPNTVKEAAKLLVNDYACADANYRDRYLTSMTAADWRIQFNAGAFINTGNVRADQLLEPYVMRRGWAVL
jgi:hypothetical protein